MATFPEPRDSYDQDEERRFRRYLEQELLALRALTEEEPEEEPPPDLSYGWEIVDDVVLDAAAESINITGLDAEGYEEYQMRVYLTRASGTGALDLDIFVNSLDQSGDYEGRWIAISESVSDLRGTTNIQADNLVHQAQTISEWTFRREPSGSRLAVWGRLLAFQSGRNWYGGYVNSASNLDTVEFKVQPQTPVVEFAAGSRVVVFGRNTPDLPEE